MKQVKERRKKERQGSKKRIKNREKRLKIKCVDGDAAAKKEQIQVLRIRASPLSRRESSYQSMPVRHFKLLEWGGCAFLLLWTSLSLVLRKRLHVGRVLSCLNRSGEVSIAEASYI